MNFEVKESFGRWANSFSGCEGGNIAGAIWFCGIEFGGGEEEEKFKEVSWQVPIGSPSAIEGGDRDAFMKYQYNQKLLKLYSSILGINPSSYAEVFEKTRAFDKSSDVFKMNLYPVAFHGDNYDLWKKWHYEVTGFPTKQLYQSWCQLNRFAAMKGWVESNAPRAIIGTSTSYRQAFMMAFNGLENSFDTMTEVELDKKKMLWCLINDKRTILFVTPFLGPGGLMRDAHINQFGREINRICENQFGKGWCKQLDEFPRDSK